MKQIGIVTINDNNNYGNRLQNYAVQEILTRMNNKVLTLKNDAYSNTKNKYLLRKIKNINYKGNYAKDRERSDNFKEFNKYINFSKKKITPYTKINNKFDYFIAGSDQVWNPASRLRDVDLLNFASDDKRISFAASFGISELPEKYNKRVKKELAKFKAISVREEAGKKIVEKLTNRHDVKVLVDPTMMLTSNDWDKVAKKPSQLKKNEKYILNYFLGDLSEKRTIEIKKFAKENNCKIINILDKNSQFYECGPSEFLYLEKNAYLICTDSFHSCVFAVIYNKPFVVFNRKDNRVNMNSRIETLLNKFNLCNKKYTGKLENTVTECNYKETYEILEKEKKQAYDFLEKALS